jgi:ribosomal protein L40E
MPDDNSVLLEQIPKFNVVSESSIDKMSWRERIANAMSGGEFSELKKKNNELVTVMRPGLPTFDYAPQYSARGWLYWSFFFEHEVSILSDLFQKKRDIIFQKGIEWKANFIKKCEKCDHEMQFDAEECESCKSTKLRDPDKDELKLWKRDEYDDFFSMANYNNQTFVDVCKQLDLHTSISDNLYMLSINKYKLDNVGNILASLPVEFIALDPRDVLILELHGRIGKRGKFCLKHRTALQAPESETCNQEDCGLKLYEAWYQVDSPDSGSLFYGKDEIYHSTFYYTSQIYGFPKPLKIADELWTYHYIEKRVRSHYENARPPGFIFIPTANQDALLQMWAKVMEQIRQRPNDIPIIATSEAAPTEANFIKLLQDPNADLIAIKEELRERIASSFGMTISMTNDTSNSGGLKNDANMVSLAHGTIMQWNSFYKEKLYRWIAKQMHIADHHLEIIPNISENEIEKAELFALEIQNAKLMQEIGFEIDYKPTGNSYGKFEFSGEAKTPEERMEGQLSLEQQYAPKPSALGAKAGNTPKLNKVPPAKKSMKKSEE